MVELLRRIEHGSRIGCVCAAILLPVAVWGAVSIRTGNSSVHDWLPDTRQERIVYDQFVERFGDDQFLLVSWEDARIDDPRLEAMRNALLNQDARLPQPAFVRVESSATLIDSLTGPPIGLSSEEARRRIEGTAIGNDGTACVLILLSEAGILAAGDTIDLVDAAAKQVDGLTQQDLFVVGTLMEEVSVDRAGDRSLRRLVLPSTLAAILVAILSLGKVRECILVFVLASFGQLLSVAILYYTGGEFTAVLIVLPTLVFMLSLSSAVHLINYYHDVEHRHAEHRAARALLMGLRPTVLASMTTAIGMSSLVVSELAPIRQFGLYAGLTLSVATCFLLILFPWLTHVGLSKSTGATAGHQAVQERWNSRFGSLAQSVQRHALLIAVCGLLSLSGAAWGLTRLQASTKFDRMFPSDSSTIQSMRWVEQHVGPFVSIEVLLDFPDEDANPLQRVRWLTTIQRNLNNLPEVGSTLSAASFLPAIPTASGIRAAASRAIFNAKLRQQLPTLIDQGWINRDGGRQQWRITCKVSGLQDEDYGVFVDRVQSATKETIDAHADQADKPLEFSTTGLSPLVHEAQLMLLSDLAQSFLMAFALITPVMMLITRSVVVGGLVMLPNVLPVAIVFGSMGWLGIRMDIAGVLTASIALGIAVDDTLHFVSWYTHAKRAGQSSRDAIFAGYQRCALAMLETTLIACSAMLPFLFADFIPTRRFAMLMMLMLTLAIVGDLLLLPALLCCHDRLRHDRLWRRARHGARFDEASAGELRVMTIPGNSTVPRQKPRRRQ